MSDNNSGGGGCLSEVAKTAMANNGIKEPERSQPDKFKDAAKKAGCDPDEKRWAERLKKVAKATPGDAKSDGSPRE